MIADETQKISVLDDFLVKWRDSARQYYFNLYDEFEAVRKRQYDINEENLKKIMNWDGKRQYSDERIAEILSELPNRERDYKYEISHQMTRNWMSRHIQRDMAIITNICKLDDILDKEVAIKREKFIEKVEAKAGEILDSKYLRIGLNGEINGYVIGNKAKVSVLTITAGGYNIQCFHYRVLVNIMNN